MKEKLKVSFDNPEHGWVGLFINYGEEAITIIASYTPSDSFLDLTNALYTLLYYPIEATIVLNEEPAETELRFSASSGIVRLEVYTFPDTQRIACSGKRILEISGSYEEICVPFWRALRGLQGRFSAKELGARWHRPFPWKDIEQLTEAINGRLD